MDLPEDPYTQTTEHGDLVGLTMRPLNEISDINHVRDASAGAICTFVGTTRDNFQGKRVEKLEYEAYPSMAIKTMASIVAEARQLALQGFFSFDWPNYTSPHDCGAHQSPPRTDLIVQSHSLTTQPHATALTRICLIHRLRVVPPTESSISIAVSSPHRKEAFRAAEWILEEVKKRVEVWKREVYRDSESGSAWKENFPSNDGKS